MVSTIVGTAVTGLLLLAVALFVVRGMDWRSYSFEFGHERESAAEALGRYAHHPGSWAAAFVLLVLLTGAISLAALGAITLPLPGGMAAVGIVFGLLLAIFPIFGTYGLVRSRERSTAEATLASLVVVAGLFLLFISANLVFGFLGG